MPVIYCQTCGWKIHYSEPKEFTCKMCGYAVNPDDTDAPKHAWPKWAKYIARLRKDEEAGVGSTLERMFKKIGGDQFKLLCSSIGIPCGCVGRRDELNEKYSYTFFHNTY